MGTSFRQFDPKCARFPLVNGIKYRNKYVFILLIFICYYFTGNIVIENNGNKIVTSMGTIWVRNWEHKIYTIGTDIGSFIGTEIRSYLRTKMGIILEIKLGSKTGSH